MNRDEIAEIEIDGKGRLLVKPRTCRFPFIYREAMEVHWDNEANYLYSPPPREWSYVQWFKQILAAAREQSCDLYLSKGTAWSGISEALKQEIVNCTEAPDA